MANLEAVRWMAGNTFFGVWVRFGIHDVSNVLTPYYIDKVC